MTKTNKSRSNPAAFIVRAPRNRRLYASSLLLLFGSGCVVVVVADAVVVVIQSISHSFSLGLLSFSTFWLFFVVFSHSF